MKIILYFILKVLLSVSLVNALSSSRNGSRIIGGEIAWSGQYPYMAAIYKTTSTGNYFCGGAILNNQWILRAGTCVDEAILFSIYLGATNLQDIDGPNTLRLATEEFVVHPEFNAQTLENDVGLIKLRMEISFTMYIRPIDYLPTFELLPGTPGVVGMGWGQISDDEPDLVDELRYVYLTPLTDEECRLVYGNQITEKMVCAAGNNNEGICLGDSGTPLIRIRQGPTHTHIGIASFISQNGCESTDPSGYTTTFDFVDWIRNVTEM